MNEKWPHLKAWIDNCWYATGFDRNKVVDELYSLLKEHSELIHANSQLKIINNEYHGLIMKCKYFVEDHIGDHGLVGMLSKDAWNDIENLKSSANDKKETL